MAEAMPWETDAPTGGMPWEDSSAPEPTHEAKSGTWTSHFKNLVAGLQEAIPEMGNLATSFIDRAMGIPVDSKAYQEAKGKAVEGLADKAGAVTGITPSKVQQNGFGDMLARNTGRAAPYLAAGASGGLANTAKNLLVGESAVTGQTVAQASGGGPVAQTVGALLGGLAGAKATRIPSSVTELLTSKTDEEKASSYVNDLTTTSGKKPEDLEAFANQPGNEDKPFTGAEAIGRQGITGARALALRQGTTGDKLSAQLEERAAATPERLKGDFQEATGMDPDAALGELDNLVKAGRARAKPLYDKSNESSDMVPFEQQFEQENNRIGRSVEDAQQELNDANTKLTVAEAKVHNAGNNVYGANSALSDRRAAQDAVEAAQEKLDSLQSEQGGIDARLKQAQTDKARGVRGGIWSPFIQRVLSLPEARAGLKSGYAIEQKEAVHDRRPFNNKDYAITGLDDEGVPIVKGVPNMKTLDMVKRGFDAELRQRAEDNHGVLPKDPDTTALLKVKDEFLKEIDSLNPHYKAARNEASDYLSANDAFKRAQKMVGTAKFTNKQFQDFLGKLDSDTERDAAKRGVANWFFDTAAKGQLKGQKFTQPILRQKLEGIVADPEKASKFLMRMDSEAGMAKSGQRMHPGMNSATFESGEAANAQDKIANALAVAKMLHSAGSGNVFSAVGHGLDVARRFGGQSTMSIPTRNEAGRLLMLPPKELAQHLRDFNATETGARLAKAKARKIPLRGLLPAYSAMTGRKSKLGDDDND